MLTMVRIQDFDFVSKIESVKSLIISSNVDNIASSIVSPLLVIIYNIFYNISLF